MLTSDSAQLFTELTTMVSETIVLILDYSFFLSLCMILVGLGEALLHSFQFCAIISPQLVGKETYWI